MTKSEIKEFVIAGLKREGVWKATDEVEPREPELPTRRPTRKQVEAFFRADEQYKEDKAKYKAGCEAYQKALIKVTKDLVDGIAHIYNVKPSKVRQLKKLVDDRFCWLDEQMEFVCKLLKMGVGRDS